MKPESVEYFCLVCQNFILHLDFVDFCELKHSNIVFNYVYLNYRDYITTWVFGIIMIVFPS